MLARCVAATLLAVASISGGCAEGATVPGQSGFEDEVDPRDLQPYSNEKFDGALSSFDANLVVDDALFENADAVTAEAVQDLLESSPYGNRSFLADELVGGKPFSQVVVEVAQAHRINPVLLLARLQVEKSLVAKTARPSAKSVDFALGCGCHDGKACSEAFRGLDRQLQCGAQTLRTHFDGSADGSGQWALGEPRESLDGETVTPASHGTASLYAYTPWVLEGSGGNWLVWNVTRKYIGALLDRGTYDVDDGSMDEPADDEPGSCADRCGSVSAVPNGEGSACFCDADCRESGDCCDDWAELCSDDAGTDDGSSSDDGGSSSDDGGADDGADPGVGSCVGVCGTQTPVDDGDGTQCWCDATCTLSGDCCGDYEAVCDGAPAGPSCAGVCGSSEPQAVGDGTQCFCDEACASIGDCCSDYDAAC